MDRVLCKGYVFGFSQRAIYSNWEDNYGNHITGLILQWSLSMKTIQNRANLKPCWQKIWINIMAVSKIRPTLTCSKSPLQESGS